MAVISIFTFNGENAILKLHLGVLEDYVDKFIIVEANKTFTGRQKPLLFFRDERYFKEWHRKIEYYPMTMWDDPELWDMANKSPNTQGASHWKREFYIKESLHKALELNGVKDDDLIIMGDVDEILDPSVEFHSETPVKARLRVYAYYLNNLSSEVFYGPLVAQYKDIKDKCLNDLRADKSLYSGDQYLGWHFTSMGGIEEVRRKLDDSYTLETYNTPEVQNLLPERIEEGIDYLGRPFSFTTDESNWPDYLKKNRKSYERMCKTHN